MGVPFRVLKRARAAAAAAALLAGAAGADVTVTWYDTSDHVYDSAGVDHRTNAFLYQVILDVSNDTDVGAMLTNRYWRIGTEDPGTTNYRSRDDVTLSAQNTNWFYDAGGDQGYVDGSSTFDEALYGNKRVYFRIFNAPATNAATEAGLVYDAARTNWVTAPDSSAPWQLVCELTRGGADAAFARGSLAAGHTDGWATMTTNVAATTNYLLTVASAGNGAVSVTGGLYAAGTTVPVAATATSYYHFAYWSGDTNGCPAVSNQISVVMTGVRQVWAHFAPNLAPLGTPEWWLALHRLTNGGLTFSEAETNGGDADGAAPWQEWIADTDPTNSASYFHIATVSNRPPLTFYFQSSSNRLYSLKWQSQLGSNLWPVVNGQSGVWVGAGWHWLVDTNAASGPRFYRLEAILPP